MVCPINQWEVGGEHPVGLAIKTVNWWGALCILLMDCASWGLPGVSSSPWTFCVRRHVACCCLSLILLHCVSFLSLLFVVMDNWIHTAIVLGAGHDLPTSTMICFAGKLNSRLSSVIQYRLGSPDSWQLSDVFTNHHSLVFYVFAISPLLFHCISSPSPLSALFVVFFPILSCILISFPSELPELASVSLLILVSAHSLVSPHCFFLFLFLHLI